MFMKSPIFIRGEKCKLTKDGKDYLEQCKNADYNFAVKKEILIHAIFTFPTGNMYAVKDISDNEAMLPESMIKKKKVK
jgi:hypothetical protein